MKKTVGKAVTVVDAGWTREKVDLALRMFGRVVESIAEEISVPPAELLQLYCKGKYPDLMRDGEMREPARKPRAPRKTAPPAIDHPATPGHLAGPRYYRLLGRSGKYLHRSGKGFTPLLELAWRGTQAQANGAQYVSSDARQCTLVPE